MAIDDLPPGTLAWCDHCRTASLPRYFSDGPHSGRLSEPLCQRCGLSFEYLRLTSIPVIAMTANRKAAVPRGAAGLLRKPFNLDAFLRVIRCPARAWPDRNVNEPAMAFGVRV